MLSADARSFVRSSLHSVWSLEVLKSLRTSASRVWTADALRIELRASELAIQQALAAFRAAGILAEEPGGGVRYHPPPDLDRLVIEIITEYERRPIAVIEEIYISETRKIRDFADAFRLKKDDE